MGFPTLKKVTEAFEGDDQIQFIAIQTVFEGYNFNKQDKLRQNHLKYDLKIPMAHVAGNPEIHGVPEIMRKYRAGGTPWTVIIDRSGKVVFNDFHIKVARAISFIEMLTEKRD